MASGSGGSEPPRQPRSMQGLLKFCMESTKNEDTSNTAPSSLQPMSQERKEWLENVFRGLQDSDPVKVMLDRIKVILDPAEEDVVKEEALEDLQEKCEDMDISNDFHKIGGFEFLQSMFRHSHAGIRWRAAFLLATLVQNNPYCQERALQMGLLPELLSMIDTDADMEVRVKALLATSCLCRDVAACQTVFVEHDGFSVLLRAMEDGNEKLQTKAAFMIQAMCASRPDFKSTMVNMGLVEQMTALLRGEHAHSHEHILSALHALITDNTQAWAEASRPDLDLPCLLRDKHTQLKDKSEYEEEVNHVTALLELLSTPAGSSTQNNTRTVALAIDR